MFGGIRSLEEFDFEGLVGRGAKVVGWIGFLTKKEYSSVLLHIKAESATIWNERKIIHLVKELCYYLTECGTNIALLLYSVNDI